MRIILTADKDDLDLALRAAQYLLSQPTETKDALIQYNGDPRLTFWAQRTKTGISVRRCSVS